MDAVLGDPPAVARQRVRRALRSARRATPLSQGDVAKKLGWSLSKMQRIEGGEVGVSLTDLRALLDVYGITDADEVARLTADARVSRRQRWLTTAEHRTHLTPAMRQLMQFEKEAVAIRAFQPILLPGPLQTPAVADTVLGWHSNAISEDDRRVRFDVRMGRRKHLVEDPDGPAYHLILDESVIKRRIGGAKTMAEQLEALVEVAQRPNVHVRVVPFETSAQAGLADAFQIVNLSDDEEDAIVYRESYDHDHVVHDPREVVYFRGVFEQILAVSLSEPATLRRIAAEAMQLRSSLD